MSVIDNPKNYTYQLMQLFQLINQCRQAQASRALMGKIHNIKASVDNKSPKSYSNMSEVSGGYPKKARNHGRRREVELENNVLIQKMLKIMQVNSMGQPYCGQRGVKSTNTSPKQNPGAKSRLYLNEGYLPGGGVPAQYQEGKAYQGKTQSPLNRTYMKSDISQVAPYINSTKNKRIGSLNYFKRKKDIDNINSNNRQLLVALQNTKPVISREEQRNHEKRIKKLKQHIGQIRYVSPSNFLSHDVSLENNNFYSSQHQFAKSPNHANIREAKSQKRKRNQQSMSQTQQRGTSAMDCSQNIKDHQSDFTRYEQVNAQSQSAFRSQTPIYGGRGSNIHPNSILHQQLRGVILSGQGYNSTTNFNRTQDGYQSQKLLNQSPQYTNLAHATQIKPQSAQRHRKLKSKNQSQPEFLNQSQTQLQIATYQHPVMLQQRDEQEHATSAKLISNPYAQSSVGAARKFVKQGGEKKQIVRNETQINIYNTNVSSPKQSTPNYPAITNIQLPKTINKPNKIESPEILLEPKILVNLVDGHNKLAEQIYLKEKATPKYDQLPQQQHYPQFLNETPKASEELTDNPSKFSNMTPNQNNTKISFQRANTRRIAVEHEETKQKAPPVKTIARNQVMLAQEQKKKANLVNEAIMKERMRKQRIQSKVIQFTSILKRRVRERKFETQMALEQESREAAAKFFNKALGEEDINKEESQRYSRETFDSLMEKQENLNDESKAIANSFVNLLGNDTRNLGLEFVKNLAQSHDFDNQEKQIIEQVQNIFKSILDKEVKKKAQKLVVQFISTLHRKVDEKKQQQSLKQMLAKGFSQMENLDESPGLFPARASSPLISKEFTEDQLDPSLNIIRKLKYNVHKHNSQQVQKTIGELFSQMRPSAKGIILRFFEVLWRKGRIRQLKRKFILAVKGRAAANKDYRLSQLNKHVINKFRILVAHDHNEEGHFDNAQDSLSIHYSQDSQRSRLRQGSARNEKSTQKLNGKQIDLQRAQKNALRFIGILVKKKESRKRVDTLIKKFVNIVKSNWLDKKNKKQKLIMALMNLKTKKEVIPLGQINKLKQQECSFNISEIKDLQFHLQIKKIFKKLFVKLFQLNSRQRSTKIFALYFAQDFKGEITKELSKWLNNSKIRDRENLQVKNQVKAFLFLNQLKSKYQRQNGLAKSHEYINRLRVAALKTRIQKRQLAHLLSMSTNSKEKLTFIRQFAARLFQQKPYSYYERYNPFQNTNINKQQVKRFLADCFQRNHELVGRLPHIFGIKATPSTRRVKYFIAKVFLQKKFRANVVMTLGSVLAMAKALRMKETRKKNVGGIVSLAQVLNPALHTFQNLKSKQKKNYLKILILVCRFVKIFKEKYSKLRLTKVKPQTAIARLFNPSQRDKADTESKLIIALKNQQKKVQFVNSKQPKEEPALSSIGSDDQSSAAALMANQFMSKMLAQAKEHINESKGKIQENIQEKSKKDKWMKGKHRGRDIVQIGMIRDKQTHINIKNQFKKLFVRLFLLSAEQRNSKIHSLYFAKKFKNSVVNILEDFLKRIVPEPQKENPEVLKQVKAFICLNKLRVKYQKQKGALKAKEYIYRLRFCAIRLRKQRAQLKYLLDNTEVRGQKLFAIRHFIARLFQYKGYTFYQRYNPFFNNVLTKFQVKRFIADLFQSYQEVVGRPKDIFRNKRKKPSQRTLRFFVAKQFQKKHMVSPEQQLLLCFRNQQIFATVKRFTAIVKTGVTAAKDERKQNVIATAFIAAINRKIQKENLSRLLALQDQNSKAANYSGQHDTSTVAADFVKKMIQSTQNHTQSSKMKTQQVLSLRDKSQQPATQEENSHLRLDQEEAKRQEENAEVLRAKQFVNMFKQPEEIKTEENVKKFVNIFKSSYGKNKNALQE